MLGWIASVTDRQTDRQNYGSNSVRAVSWTLKAENGVGLHVVALAVADSVEAVVEESILPWERFDRVRAPVVLLAAAVRRQDGTVRLTSRRHVPSPAPTSTRHNHLHTSTTSHPGSLRQILLLLLVRDGWYCFVYRQAAKVSESESKYSYLPTYVRLRVFPTDILVNLSYVRYV